MQGSRTGGFFCCWGVWGSCLAVLASTLDWRIIPLFGGRLSSLTECSASGGSTWSSGRGRGPGNQPVQGTQAWRPTGWPMSWSDHPPTTVAFGRGELFVFKGQQNSSRHTSSANLWPDTLKSIQEHPRTRRVKNWLFQICFGGWNSLPCFPFYLFWCHWAPDMVYYELYP